MLFKQKKNVHTLRKRLYQLHRQNNDKKYCLRKHQIYIQVFTVQKYKTYI